MIFPQEKKQVLKFIDQHAVELRIPAWIISTIHQLVTEHDALEKRIAEMVDAQVKLIDRAADLYKTYEARLLESGWTLNPDGEWVYPLTCDAVPEAPEETLECWM